jgi:hypothetical protein
LCCTAADYLFNPLCWFAGATTLSVNGHKPRVALPVREAVEKQVVRVMKALLLGSAGPKPDTSIAAAFGSVAAAFLRNRCGCMLLFGKLNFAEFAARVGSCCV